MMTTDLIYELWLLNDLMTTKVNDDYWLYLMNCDCWIVNNIMTTKVNDDYWLNLWVVFADWFNEH